MGRNTRNSNTKRGLLDSILGTKKVTIQSTRKGEEQSILIKLGKIFK